MEPCLVTGMNSWSSVLGDADITIQFDSLSFENLWFSGRIPSSHFGMIWLQLFLKKIKIKKMPIPHLKNESNWAYVKVIKTLS